MSAATSVIYKILCTPTGKFYIGSAVSFSKRKAEHLRRLRNGTHVNPKLQGVFNKYGQDALHFSILIRCGKGDLLRLEQVWMDRLKPSLNISPFANRPAPQNWTPDKRQAAAVRARTLFAGKRHTEETRRVIAEKAKARYRTKGHPLQGTVWSGDRQKQAETMRRLHREGRLFSHAKLYGVSEEQKQKTRATIARNGGRKGIKNGHYKPEIDEVFCHARDLIVGGISIKDALRITGLPRSTYYKRMRKEQPDGRD
jgi:group I intron endonuclease